jgi:hypothetical protein
MNEQETKKGFVKQKIKTQSLKKGCPVARARMSQTQASLVKVMKKSAQLADLMTGEDLEEDMRLLRGLKRATTKMWDPKQKKLIDVPDNKTRLAALALSRAHHEGLPVQRSISAHADYEDLQTLLEAMKHSPASQASLQKAVER